MKQILQNFATGETVLKEVPVPSVGAGEVLISANASLISPGTEKMLIDFGKSNLIQKAMQQPDKVKDVLQKVKTDGVFSTYEAVSSKLNQPFPLGYSHVGVIKEVGRNITDLQVGDRVVSNGGHADFVCVPRNLVAKVPGSVSDDEAVFTVLGSIALQGIRLVAPTLGETVAVFGLGTIGLLTVQLLIANGCRVIAFDFDKQRSDLAEKYGATTCLLHDGADVLGAAARLTNGRGIDAAIIAASTKSNDPVSQAARMCRKRGRIVLVGVVGLELNRSEFFEKELSFQVSCSYGPGRYDPAYEQEGVDYPFGYVRWTENRNFEAFLDLAASGKITGTDLITHRKDFSDAVAAYELLGPESGAIGVLLEYPKEQSIDKASSTVNVPGRSKSSASNPQGPVCAFIGAGNYASRVLIPAFKRAKVNLHTVVSNGGVSAAHQGEVHGFSHATTDVESVISNDEINMVVVATRHNTHAKFVAELLKAGKHVFVEKPLAITAKQLSEIESVYEPLGGQKIMVGFNRRFAPHVIKMKSLLDEVSDTKAIVMTINAGSIPAESWVQDRSVGGGRIIGEGCHFVDLMRFLIGADIVSVQCQLATSKNSQRELADRVIVLLGFADGSCGSIHYLSNGGKSFPKERIEAFAGDAVLQLDNFRTLRGFGWGGFKTKKSFKQDKGQEACANAFVDSVRNGSESPIPFKELIEVSKVCFEIDDFLNDALVVE